MLRRHHCDDASAAEFPRLYRIVANSPFDESESEARIEDSLDDFLGVADLQIETHLRIADVEGRYEGRQQVGADRVARADRELAAFEIGEFAHRALCRLVEPEDARGIVQEHLASLRQAHPPRQAIEQQNAEALLEGAQFTRYGRLRRMQKPRCGIDAASLGDAVKDRKVPQVHRSQ